MHARKPEFKDLVERALQREVAARRELRPHAQLGIAPNAPPPVVEEAYQRLRARYEAASFAEYGPIAVAAAESIGELLRVASEAMRQPESTRGERSARASAVATEAARRRDLPSARNAARCDRAPSHRGSGASRSRQNAGRNSRLRIRARSRSAEHHRERSAARAARRVDAAEAAHDVLETVRSAVPAPRRDRHDASGGRLSVMAAEWGQRRQLEELSTRLREATWAALENRSALARSLDESRGEIERLLMMSAIEATEHRRAIVRAQMMLNAWEGMAAGSFARSR